MLAKKGNNNSYIDSTKYQIVIVEDSGRTNTKAFAGGYNSSGTITNHAANMFIERRDDNYSAADSINNTADDVTIDAGYGYDTISNSGSNVSIFGGAGKDTVTNSGFNVSIDAGAGDDLIINNAAENVTITTGDGSDVISIGAAVKSFTVTDELSSNDKIVFEGGSISSLTTTEDNVVIATVGSQVVSIAGFPHGESGKATWKRDTATNIAQYAPANYSAALSSDSSSIIVSAESQGDPLIKLGGIVNTDAFTTDTANKIVSMPFSSNVMIGEGASILSNSEGYAFSLTSGYNVKKFYGSGEGDSIITAGNSGRTIFGGAGNDSLVDTGSQNTLHGGDGNDTLVHESSYASTLNGEAGDDLIVIKGTGANLASHVYTGDGNDSVSIGADVQRVVLEDFSNSDKIIFEKEVTSVESGALGYNNYTGITATYEDGATVKIAGVHVPQTGEWKEGAFYNNTPQGAQVSTETIDGEEKSVITVTTAIGGTEQFEIYNGGSFTNLINNSTVNTASKTATFNPAAFRNVTDGTQTYISKNTEGYQFIIANDAAANREVTKRFGQANAYTNDTITNHADNMFIDGGRGADSLINDGSNVTIDGGAGADIISNSGSNVSINGGEDNDVINLTGGTGATVNVSEGNDTINISSSIESLTVESFDTGDVISFAESVSVENTDGGFIATFGNGSAVSIGGVSLAAYSEGAWSLKESVASYGRTYLAGNQLSDDGKTITYGENKLTDSAQVELDDIKSTDGMTPAEKVISLKPENFSGNVSVKSNTENYQFSLSGEFNNQTFTGTSDNDSIVNDGTNIKIDSGAGNDLITNNAAANVTISTGGGNDTIKLGASVTAVNITDFSVDDEIELTNNATELESIDGGIQAGNVSISGINALATATNGWSIGSGDIIYQTWTTAGAKLDNNIITLAEATDKQNEFMLSGLNSSVGVSISGNDVILDSNALKDVTGTVSISGDYKLKLAEDVDTLAENISASLTGSNGTFTYTAAGVGEHYSLDGSQVIYTAATQRDTFTISGLGDAKLNDNVIVSEKSVEVKSGAFTSDHATISLTSTDGYTLAVNDSLVTDIPFAQDGNKVTLAGTTEGYKANENGEYVWQAQVGGEELTITGLKDGATLTADMFSGSGDSIVFKPTDALLDTLADSATITIDKGRLTPLDLLRRRRKMRSGTITFTYPRRRLLAGRLARTVLNTQRRPAAQKLPSAQVHSARRTLP